ncbi:endolytic transglycosylase MltG [Rhodococcus sp. NPDC060086]|uniref:endolytic transglycosylase MltG n=1 Tax=Rhodococcus sp. NPDC060086 TaxID=3347055 RepID=UPI0036549F6F
MTRDGRYGGDDTPDARQGGMFSDPYAGNYDTAGRYTPPPPAAAPPRDEYGQARSARGRHPDDDPTNVLHFEEGVFDGPPPQEPRAEDGPRQPSSDDEYVGGYSYAQRRKDDYSDGHYDGAGYDGAGYGESGVFDRTETIAAVPADDEADDQSWDDDERAAPAAVGATAAQRAETTASSKRRKRGKVVGSLAAVLLLIVVVGGGYFAYDRFLGPGLPPDFTGPAGPVAIVQVNSGETATEIGREAADKGVVASADAFYNAAVQNAGMNAVHPGFYAIPTNVSGVDAVSALVAPESRVGALVVSEGRQLHDIRDVNTGAVRKGIYTLIAESSCYDDVGATQCLTYEELAAAGATTDLDALGVPVWARDAVAQVPDRERQLEGLIAAGSWDFDPSAEPVEVLRTLVTGSAARYDETGIVEAAPTVGLTPYEMLVAASLVEREALPDDFARVARVILNRLEIDQMLQFDSTVNYALDETELATTDADRARVTPWNTYASVGLPATPISSPSIGALQAVENPETGDWTYFVTIDDQGTTLFADTYDEHLVNTRLALESGILDSGR